MFFIRRSLLFLLPDLRGLVPGLRPSLLRRGIRVRAASAVRACCSRSSGTRLPAAHAGTVAKLAFSRVSVAFRKASRPQADSMALPPLETKGKVTPVRGRRSTEPKTFRLV
jgi:hypothetical protein